MCAHALQHAKRVLICEACVFLGSDQCIMIVWKRCHFSCVASVVGSSYIVWRASFYLLSGPLELLSKGLLAPFPLKILTAVSSRNPCLRVVKFSKFPSPSAGIYFPICFPISCQKYLDCNNLSLLISRGGNLSHVTRTWIAKTCAFHWLATHESHTEKILKNTVSADLNPSWF